MNNERHYWYMDNWYGDIRYFRTLREAKATGARGAASATGIQGAASAFGYQGAASATGDDSIALAAGYMCRAKAALGCFIVLAEREAWNGKTYPLVDVKAFRVDGKTVKPDVWYMLRGGDILEVTQ